MAGAHTARACLLALTATAWLGPSRSQQLEDALPALSPLASLNLDEHGPGRQCARDTRALVAAVRNRTLWAVRMLDASARVSSGVLWGARYQLGSYDGCKAVGASSPVGARYCLVSVNHKTDGQARGTWETVEDLPPYQDVSTVLRGEGMLPGSLPLGDIRMGLCVPASCTAATLQAALQAGLDSSVRVHVGPENCQEHVTGASLSTGATLFWGLVVALTAVSVAAPALGWTSWDWSRHVHSLGQPDPMVSGIDLSPLAGIRVISTMIIVCLHRGFRTMRVATSNAEYLTSWARSHSRFAWVYRGTLCVDTFFLLAGLLLAAATLADRKSSFPNIMFNRALRLLPVYAIVVLFCCTALPDMGEGPLWVEVAQPMADSCRKWWWSNLLFIQNYVNGGTDEPMCMEHSWSLAVDMHLFIAGTLLLRWLPVGMRGLAALLGLAVLATVPLTVGTLLGGWPATPPWTLRNIQRVWAMPFLYQAYVPTHMRAPPYLLGLATGKALHMLKNAGFRPGRTVTLLATVASLASMVAVVCFGASLNDLRVPYSALASGLYAGLAPFAWSAAIAVLIIVTVLGEPSVVRSLLSWQPLVTLSRLTFPVYLVSYPLQTLLTAAHRDAVRFTPLAVVPDAMSDCVISFAVSFWLFVVVEAPIRSVAKKALSRLGDSSKPQSKTALIRKSD